MTYEYGPDVTVSRVLIDGGPGFAEHLNATECPSCGANWTQPNSVRLGHQVGREYLCWACMRFHRARHAPAD